MSRPLLLALTLAHGTTIVATNAGAVAERLAEAWGHELCAPATRLRAPWPRKKAANLPERWLAALWAGVGRWEESDVLATKPEREDLAVVAASVRFAPAGDQAWASIGA